MNKTQQVCLLYAFTIGQPSTYLEVGCCEGDSLEYVTRECLSIRSATVIDNWSSHYGGSGRGSHEHVANRFYGVIRPNFEFLDGDSRAILPEMTRSFDLVHIDGDHSSEGAAIDLREGWRMTNPGGWLVFDDTFHPAHSYLQPIFERVATTSSDLWFHVTDADGGCSAMRKPV